LSQREEREELPGKSMKIRSFTLHTYLYSGRTLLHIRGKDWRILGWELAEIE